LLAEAHGVQRLVGVALAIGPEKGAIGMLRHGSGFGSLILNGLLGSNGM
jgi:hypothetical protein